MNNGETRGQALSLTLSHSLTPSLASSLSLAGALSHLNQCMAAVGGSFASKTLADQPWGASKTLADQPWDGAR